MAKFVKGNGLNAAIESIFDEAEGRLTIISPFIKLHQRFIDSLKSKIDNPKLEVKLVFGKNESNKSKSLSLQDFEFFKQFANVKIYYEPRLHAKYYANQNTAVLSSMNLYEYSQNNNIEFGIVTQHGMSLERLKDKVMGVELDNDAWDYFNSVVDGSELVFHNEPVFESNMLGLSKKYIRSEVKVDLLTEELSKPENAQKIKPKKPAEVKSIKPKTASEKGYCIRTGEQIPFDLTKPYSEKAYQAWSRYKNEDFNEKYCHFSGEPSEGKTSMAKPILGKNWKLAKIQFKLI